jgi:outer membrane receptor protein involved in Fe transport
MFFILFVGAMYAQNIIITVTGKVINSKQEPLANVQIVSKETKKGTITDFEGKFTLKGVENNELLLFSFVGYETKKNPAKAKMNIVLKETISDLDLVVVTASRTVQKRKDLPVAISSISRTTIEEIQPTSIDQVVNQIPGVLMVDLGNEQHMMAIRQPISTKSLFLYLEDGIPIRPTGVFNHNALLEMNMESIKNIEVIRGPYSSLYGSEAIGGAINFITENPSKKITGKIGVKGHNYGYSRIDIDASNSYGKMGVYVGGYYAQIKNGIRDYGDFNKAAITAKVTYDFSKSLNIHNTVTYVDYFSEMSGSLDQTKFENKDYSSYHTFTFRDAKALRFNSTLNKKWKNDNNTTLSLVYRDNKMKQNPSYRIADDTPFDSHTTGELNDNSFNSYAAYLQHNIKFKTYKANLSLGSNVDFSPKTYYAKELDVYRDANGMFSNYTETGIYKSDYAVDIVNTGFFIAGDMEPFKKFKINAAIRYDIYSYDFKNRLDSASDFKAQDAKESFHSFTPRIGFAYNFTKNIGVYSNYSVGFIPPSIRDLFRKNDVPLLNPTTFDSYEVGGWLGLLNNKFYFDLSVYYMIGKDEVVSVTTKENGVTIRENKNVGETSHKGIEFGLKYKVTDELKFRYSGAVSQHKYDYFVTKIVDGQAVKDYSGNEMQGAPKWIANAGVNYKPKYVNGLRFDIEWQHIGKYYTDLTNENTYQGYDVFNARMGYEIKKFNFYTNLMNLTNKLYSTRTNTSWGKTTYTPGNPFTILIGVNYKL